MTKRELKDIINECISERESNNYIDYNSINEDTNIVLIEEYENVEYLYESAILEANNFNRYLCSLEIDILTEGINLGEKIKTAWNKFTTWIREKVIPFIKSIPNKIAGMFKSKDLEKHKEYYFRSNTEAIGVLLISNVMLDEIESFVNIIEHFNFLKENDFSLKKMDKILDKLSASKDIDFSDPNKVLDLCDEIEWMDFYAVDIKDENVYEISVKIEEKLNTMQSKLKTLDSLHNRLVKALESHKIVINNFEDNDVLTELNNAIMCGTKMEHYTLNMVKLLTESINDMKKKVYDRSNWVVKKN